MRQQATRKLSEEMLNDEEALEDMVEMPDFSAVPPAFSPVTETVPAPMPTTTDLPPTKEPAAMNATPPSSAPLKLGARLQQAREERGLQVDDVANRLYLEPRIIEALEKERYAQLPPVIFVQGYLRSYARLLGLPVEEILSAYYAATDQAPPQLIPDARLQRRNMAHAGESPRSAKRWWSGMTLLLVLVLIGLVAWRYADYLSLPNFTMEAPVTTPEHALELPPQSQPSSPAGNGDAPALPPSTDNSAEYTPPTESASGEETVTETPPLPASTAPAPLPPAAPSLTAETVAAPGETPPATATQAAPNNSPTATPGTEAPQPAAEATASNPAPPLLEITLNADCWTEITDSTGKRLIYATLKAGERSVATGTPPLKVSLGRKESVTALKFLGKDVDLTQYRTGKARFTLEQ